MTGSAPGTPEGRSSGGHTSAVARRHRTAGAGAARRQGIRRAAPRRGRLRGLALAGTLAWLLVLLAAVPASAHAVLQSTDPPANARLDAAPRAVTLTFNEPVEAAVGAIRVIDASGKRVDRGRVEHPQGESNALRVELQDGVTGGIAVGYRIISADSHPVQGAFTFGVGGATGDEAAAVADELLAGEGGSSAVGAVFAGARWLLFGSLILLIGVVAFVRRLWPAGRGLPAIRRLLWWSWGVLVGVTVAAVGLEGAYAAGLPLPNAADPLLFADMVGTRYGMLALARVALLLIALPVVANLCRPAAAVATKAEGEGGDGEAPVPWFAGLLDDLVLLLGVGLLLTVALSGHASTGRLVPLAIVTDVVHLGAASLWVGGLVTLLVALLPRRDPAELGAVVPRFSSTAFACVAAIAATGAIQGWRQLGSIDALVSTSYGRLLIAKVVGVAALVSLGWVSRRAVRRRLVPATTLAVRPAGPGADRAENSGPAAAALRRTVAAEVAIAVVVLALTSLLVNAVPARAGAEVSFGTVAPGSPQTGQAGAEIKLPNQTVVVLVNPARAGDNELHFSIVDGSGQLVPVDGFSADMRLPSQNLGPIKLDLFGLGPGHYAATGVQVPIKGTWKLTVKVRQSDIDEDVGTADIRIR
jgi:copper transport protein